ncbi:Fe-S protein assembly co-chaperone HscB [Psychromonas sp. MB-3u-54]|uniref:Fe-S protein assembly co-chaperone HscB n=1 Tax=Psychromonas sp. MB-3u-54 TaxID=2058319 RepID=UPI000C349AA1|nr:Fe-S protein assembly co-chaperone HscB [Psychromonas sp. MB-3u-54]PKH03171.1 Fe-S protein assembly co-chaperone HscB [Psychromonas sp. MB-3u-54]
MNYFDLFSLPVIFPIDQARLSETYRELQKQTHPDKFVMKSDSERLRAMQKSTEINDAYQTLKNSCLRAQYLLLLAGLDIALEQKTLQDTAFLVQQMEWRESIAAFTEDDQDKIDEFALQLQQQVADLESKIEVQLQNDELEATANSIRQLKFMLKLQIELALIEEKLFD